MHPENTTANTMYIPTNTIINATSYINSSETGLTNPTLTNSTTYWPPSDYQYVTDIISDYGVASTNDYIAISKDLSEEIRKFGYNLNMVTDAFSEFCERLIDLHEDMRLDEAFHDSEDLDDFLKEFIVNNKKN